MNIEDKSNIYAEVLEPEALEQYEAAMALPCVLQGALMPDAHKGYSLPIGAVVKTKDEVFPSFVGYDIGCGVAMMELDINYKNVNLEKLKEHILKTIPIGFNGQETPQDTSTLSFDGTSNKLRDIFSAKGRKQLGTLGGGNHFIEVGYLESNGNIAIVIHSGSRGLGHGVASYYMQEAAAQSAESGWSIKKGELTEDFLKRNQLFHDYNPLPYYKARDKYIAKQQTLYMKSQDIEGLHSFNIHSDIGSQYIIDQNFCLKYAILNRKLMLQNIVKGILHNVSDAEDIDIKRYINTNHNHAEMSNSPTHRNSVKDVKEIIHRKGATHADKGMYGVIPGNMRDGSFIVKGKGNPESLCSSSHGAGRVLSRRKARETLSIEEFQNETSKLVSNHTDKMLDEAPAAYKNIFDVMELQSDLVDVIDRVIPILNIKG